MAICGFSSDRILVGLQRVGVLGLREAIQRVAAEGLRERDEVVERMLQILARRNYIPERGMEEYRRSLWREWLRHHGRDLGEVHSPVPVIVRGEPGPRRDEFVERLQEVLGAMELRPVVAYEPEAPGESSPQLVIGGETVLRGLLSRAAIQAAIHRSISDW